MIKKIGILLLLLPALTFAQDSATDQGSLLVGGSAGFATDGEASQLYLIPSAQYFVTPGLALGGTVGISTSFNDVSLSGGPAISYFFQDGERNFVPFVSSRALFNESFSTYTMSSGAILFLNRHVGVTGELYYSHREGEFVDRDTAGLDFGIVAFVF